MDIDEFTKGMALLSEAFPSREINAKLYFSALRDVDGQAFMAAVLEIVCGTVKLYPDDNLIAMIREKISGSADDRAQLAWSEALMAVSAHGFYKSVSFADPVINGAIEQMGGWEKFSSMLVDDLPYRKKDFVALYGAISRTKRACPERLIGYFERINGRPEKTVLIGDDRETVKLLPDRMGGECAREAVLEIQNQEKKDNPGHSYG
jgi:hypothetical protein